ncbi:MAG TPA: thioredoxin domain-containing protein [Candidatus Nanoarchaeia archaeon]|nr:thioredoxin domain-containing protein [Candidatus Nanoarchaeia archaeon]
MKKAYVFLLLVGMIFLIACKGQEIVCNKPYIQVAASCCLDENGNNICDLDEKIVGADETTTTTIASATTTTTLGVTTTSLKIAWAGQAGVTTLGEENSPVKIVFYGDFGSELTRRFYDQILMYKFKTDFIDTGNVYFSYKHYLFSNTEEGSRAAEALECAADQGRFYGMMSLLAKNPDFMEVDDLKENARKLDLERGVFANCMDSGKYKDKIDESNDEAVALGGGKAPLLTINGVVYDNAALLSYYDFKKLVNSELENKGFEPVIR